jgi:orotidine-5'-phosphate decarboxylase
MPAIETVFGAEIKVVLQPRTNMVTYSGFAGAHGMTGLMHGSRGYSVVVVGTLRTNTGLTHDAALASIVTQMENLESWQYVGDQAWTYRSLTFLYTRVESVRMLPLPGSDGKFMGYTKEGQGFAYFIAALRSLL